MLNLNNVNIRLSSAVVLALLSVQADGSSGTAHVWERQEITLSARNSYANPYTDVDVWIELSGPGFRRRVYGFWDGGNTFKIRFVATAPGTWSWSTGSFPGDQGLAGKAGSLQAVDWTEEEKKQNPLRRGFIRATANQHALEYPDGTPYIVVGDTWYPAGTNRLKWYDDENRRPIGPTAGFKDYVQFRKRQGFNWICLIAAYPNWMTDGTPWNVVTDGPDPFAVRSAWTEFGTGSAKNMDNEGGRPFQFPGRMPGYEQMFPDVDRLNPEYFKYIDRKIDYLNDQGFIPFIEACRRDVSLVWSKYYKWPDSFSRFVQYVLARYQANNIVYGPIHLDILKATVLPPAYTEAIELAIRKWGGPPFGTLLSTNANPSTLVNWGEDSWITLHQSGNTREHNYYWSLTEIFHSPHPKPALNGEPYYSGFSDPRHSVRRVRAPGNTLLDDEYVRSGMYGSFLSGGFAGHIYGAEGIWGADIEAAAPTKMWDAFQWSSGWTMRHLPVFALGIGKRYQELVPDPDLISPSKAGPFRGYQGWAYCARTPDKKAFLAYFERSAPRAEVRGAIVNSNYDAAWFNPRNGAWMPVGDGTLQTNLVGVINMPNFPADGDWGLRLVYRGPGSAKLENLPLVYGPARGEVPDTTIDVPIWPGKTIPVDWRIGPRKAAVLGMLTAFAAVIAFWYRRRQHGRY